MTQYIVENVENLTEQNMKRLLRLVEANHVIVDNKIMHIKNPKRE